MARTFLTNSAISDAECTVAVGLFGLHTNTSPEPFAASAIAPRSRESDDFSTGTSLIGALISFAVRSGDEYDGEPLTSAFECEAYAFTAASRIRPDPVAMSTFSPFAPYFRAIVSSSAPML